MGLEQDLEMFNAGLEAAIKTTMEGIVAETAKEFLSDAVQTEVYEVYEPQMYDRRGRNGGLADPDNMEARYDPATMTLEVEDVRRDEDSGRLVAPVVESGEGYDYYSPGPRPFHEVAEKNFGETGTFESAVEHGLRAAGFDVKTI